ncbi:MAG: ABC transporter ATP-binding protein [Caldilinea sp.]
MQKNLTSKPKRHIMTNFLEVRGLCVAVNGNEILHQVDLAVPCGQVHALLGPNGCGKTTLMMTLMGYARYKITAGQIIFDGKDITGCDITERARLGLSLAQQRPPTIPGVTLQHLLDCVSQQNPERADTLGGLMATFQMQPFLDRAINEGLSGGEIKRSELFQLLITQPRFVMLDEPDSGIDLESLTSIGRCIDALLTANAEFPSGHKAGLIITHTGHILEHVSVENAHVMLGGHIMGAGKPHAVIEQIRQHGFEGCAHSLRQHRKEAIA